MAALEPRDRQPVVVALSESLAGMIAGPAALRIRAVEVAAALGIADAGKTLRSLLTDTATPGDVRVRALAALGELGDDRLAILTRQALHDKHPGVRAEARRWLVQLDGEAGLAALKAAVTADTTTERQQALKVLSAVADSRADDVLIAAIDQLAAGRIAADTQLDVLEAAARRDSSRLKQKIARYEAGRDAGDPLAGYRETLHGGRAGLGSTIFYEPGAGLVRSLP